MLWGGLCLDFRQLSARIPPVLRRQPDGCVCSHLEGQEPCRWEASSAAARVPGTARGGAAAARENTRKTKRKEESPASNETVQVINQRKRRERSWYCSKSTLARRPLLWHSWNAALATGLCWERAAGQEQFTGTPPVSLQKRIISCGRSWMVHWAQKGTGNKLEYCSPLCGFQTSLPSSHHAWIPSSALGQGSTITSSEHHQDTHVRLHKPFAIQIFQRV